MGLARRLRFVRSEGELEVEGRRAKQYACPHCRRLGAVNAHGFLRGYSERGENGVIRGRRFFCSNRGRRPGCGRTFSVLLRYFVAQHMVTATCLSRFVAELLEGGPLAEAWAIATDGAFHLRTGLRLWRRLRLSQGRLRRHLCRFGEAPSSMDHRVYTATWAHLAQSFPENEDQLFAAFQEHTHVGLFG